MISLSASADYGLSGQYIANITGRHPKYTFDRQFIGRKGGKRNEVSEADVDDPGLYECCDIDKKYGKESRFYLVVDIGGDLYKFKTDKADAMIVAKALDAKRPFNEIVVGTKADPEAAALNAEYKSLKDLSIVEGDLDWIGRMGRSVTLAQKVGHFESGVTVEQQKLQPVVKSEMERINARLKELAAEDKFPNNRYEIVTAKEAEKRQSAATIDTALKDCWTILQTLPAKDAKKVLAALKDKMTPLKEENCP